MMIELKLKSCPFCGGKANLYGGEIRDYVNGEWAERTHSEFWVQTNCLSRCVFGNMRYRAYGELGGIRYQTPEAAVREWNRRAEKNDNE